MTAPPDKIQAMVPSTATQLLITLVLIVPGFVYLGVLIRLRGRTPADADWSSRLMRAIVASATFAMAYLVTAGPEIGKALSQTPEQALTHLRTYSTWAIVTVIVIPVIAAGSVAAVLDSDRFKALKEKWLPERWNRIDPRPSAWDVAFGDVEPRFVRIKFKEGGWYAGYLGPNSYASSFPDPRSLFIELGYHVDAAGKIGEPIENTAGTVIDCTEAVLVELLQPPPEADTDTDADSSGTMDSEEAIS